MLPDQGPCARIHSASPLGDLFVQLPAKPVLLGEIPELALAELDLLSGPGDLRQETDEAVGSQPI